MDEQPKYLKHWLLNLMISNGVKKGEVTILFFYSKPNSSFFIGLVMSRKNNHKVMYNFKIKIIFY